MLLSNIYFSNIEKLKSNIHKLKMLLSNTYFSNTYFSFYSKNCFLNNFLKEVKKNMFINRLVLLYRQ